MHRFTVKNIGLVKQKFCGIIQGARPIGGAGLFRKRFHQGVVGIYFQYRSCPLNPCCLLRMQYLFKIAVKAAFSAQGSAYRHGRRIDAVVIGEASEARQALKGVVLRNLGALGLALLATAVHLGAMPSMVTVGHCAGLSWSEAVDGVAHPERQPYFRDRLTPG